MTEEKREKMTNYTALALQLAKPSSRSPRDQIARIEQFDRDFMGERNPTTLKCYKLVAGPPFSGIIHFIIYNLYNTRYEGAVLYGSLEFDLDTYPKHSPTVSMFTETNQFEVDLPFLCLPVNVPRICRPLHWTIGNVMRAVIARLIHHANASNSDEDIAAFYDVVINCMERNVENADFCRYFPDATFSYRKTLLSNVLDSSNSDASNVRGDAANVSGDAATDSGAAANVGADGNNNNRFFSGLLVNQTVFWVVYSVLILCIAVFLKFLGAITASFADYVF